MSLPSSMADFVPRDRYLQKAYFRLVRLGSGFTPFAALIYPNFMGIPPGGAKVNERTSLCCSLPKTPRLGKINHELLSFPSDIFIDMSSENSRKIITERSSSNANLASRQSRLYKRKRVTRVF